MSRPLVWVGIAYVLGEGLAAAGGSIWTVTAVIAVFAGLLYTGRRRFTAAQCRFMFVLPVLLIAGYLMYQGSISERDNGLCEYGSETVSFSGRVTAVAEKDSSIALTFSRAEIYSENKVRDACGIIVYADKDKAAGIEEGYILEGTGSLDIPEPATNPGQFDMKMWYLSQGIRYTLMPESISICRKNISYRTMLGRLRRRIASVFESLFDEKTAGILEAMILGDRLLLDDKIRDIFRMMGISHILAISGLHVSLIGRGIYDMLRKCGCTIRVSSLLGIFAVLSYGVLSGMSASTERAVIMFTVSMGAEYIGRTYDMMSALSLAALVIFIRQPLMISQSGVQFSFCAIIALGAVWPAVLAVIPERFRNTAFVNKAGPAAVVTIVTLPLTAVYYGEIPVLSLPVNLLILPSVSLLVPMGVLTGIIGLFSLSLAAFAGGSVNAILKFSVWLCGAAAKIPAAVYKTGVPPAWVITVFYLTLMVFTAGAYALKAAEARYRAHGSEHSRRIKELIPLERPWKWIRSGSRDIIARQVFSSTAARRKCNVLLWSVLLCAVVLLMIPFRRFENVMLFMDVGQGDGIFIRHDSVTWLVDGGSSDIDKAGEYRILPVMDYYGQRMVDYALVSHGDEDHISGVRELLEENRIRHLVMDCAGRENENLSSLACTAEKNGADVIYVSAGDRWSDGGYDFHCIYPRSDSHFTDTNDLSMVFRLDADDTSILFTGDISSEAEKEILEMYPDENSILEGIDILKCAHHGSKYSSCEEFLERLQPSLTIISCGRENRYGHPSPQTVQRITNCGSTVMCTANCGCVIVENEGSKADVKAPYSSGLER